MIRLGLTLLLLCAASQAHGQSAPQAFPTVNGSVAISVGNTYQNIISPAARKRSLTIQNNNTNGDSCWLFIGSGGATKATSILLSPGGSYQRYWPYLPIDVIQATCTTSGDTIYVDSQ